MEVGVRRRRRFWEDGTRGGISPDWIVVGIVVVLLAASLFGFWFNDMYRNGYGIFSPA